MKERKSLVYHSRADIQKGSETSTLFSAGTLIGFRAAGGKFMQQRQPKVRAHPFPPLPSGGRGRPC